ELGRRLTANDRRRLLDAVSARRESNPRNISTETAWRGGQRARDFSDVDDDRPLRVSFAQVPGSVGDFAKLVTSSTTGFTFPDSSSSRRTQDAGEPEATP